MNQIVSVLASVVGGLVVSFLIYLGLNFLVSKTGRWGRVKLLPLVFLGPVVLLLVVFLIVPVVITVYQSFLKYDQYGLSTFGGLSNYVSLFTSSSFLSTLFNNLLWIIFVPALTVIIGLAVAVLADRLGPKREKTFKTMLFVPFAISGIAASSIWSFVYFYSAPGQPQVGLLNSLWVAITNGNPVPWFQDQFLRTNSF
ncbi:MAG: sugar ABC transporter permease, partial [Gordonia polyisoprenivorans]|nr:sugar ABC transporter permease [Gordonia polyisoprenivorans]